MIIILQIIESLYFQSLIIIIITINIITVIIRSILIVDYLGLWGVSFCFEIVEGSWSCVICNEMGFSVLNFFLFLFAHFLS